MMMIKTPPSTGGVHPRHDQGRLDVLDVLLVPCILPYLPLYTQGEECTSALVRCLRADKQHSRLRVIKVSRACLYVYSLHLAHTALGAAPTCGQLGQQWLLGVCCSVYRFHGKGKVFVWAEERKVCVHCSTQVGRWGLCCA